SLKAYVQAARELLDGRYAHDRELAPPHLRVPCRVYAICCPDSILVRYDATAESPKALGAGVDETLQDVAAKFSEQLIHVPDDPAKYVPNLSGPAIRPVSIQDGKAIELEAVYPIIYAPKALPANFNLPPPSARPPCLASLHRELQVHVRGQIFPANT